MSEKKASKKTGKIKLQIQPHTCAFCSKSFSQPKTLISHMCEGKRRSMQQLEKRVQAGFMIFNRYFQITENIKVPKTYDMFCKSPFYNAFVKFGSFVTNIKPLYPPKFIDFVITSKVKLDNWCKESLYDAYLYNMLQIEPADSAIERSLQTMIQWSESTGENFNEYFTKVSLNRAVHDIKNGQISLWILLNCNSGKGLITNLADDQLSFLAPVFDFPLWKKKFNLSKHDVLMAKEVCIQSGIK